MIGALLVTPPPNPNVGGVPTELLVPVISGIVAFAAGWFSTRQARAQSHDQVVLEREANLWQTLQADNKALRARVEAAETGLRHAEDRIDELEDAMRSAGVAVPPRR